MTVTCDIKELWAQFLEHVQQKCSSTEYRNWIAPIKVGSQANDEIVLEVPNIFVQQYLLDNYQEDLFVFFPKEDLPIKFTIAKSQVVTKKIPPVKPRQHPLQLNRHYTFENFVEGPSNQFVKSAAQGVATHPGKSYNPLLIHGGVGLGKTHLLHSIGHAILQKNKLAKIHSITTEAFINDLVDHLKNKSIDKRKRFYRSLDVLLIDDIQFLQKRLNFEDELSNTFEALINDGKQIVITSDKPPSQLKLSDRMVARMEWGLVANVGVPDLETKVAIIQHKAEHKGIKIPDDIAFFIADHLFLNVRQLEGAINRLYAFSHLMHLPITRQIVEQILGEIFQQKASRKITVEAILKATATIFELRLADIKGESRQKHIALARQVSMYLAKELMDDSLQKIALSFGGKTHSTLIHAWKKISKELEVNDQLKRQLQVIKRTIEG